MNTESGSIYSKHLLKTTFNAMTDMVCLLDLQGKIIIHNQAMEKFLVLSGDRIDGSYCYELMHETDKHIGSCPFERMIISKQRENMQLEVNGRWLEVSVDPVLDDNHQIIAAVHLIKDVTEHKLLVSELEKNRDGLERTVAERTQQLSKSNKLLEETGRIARVGGWEIDLETGRNTWSEMTYQIHEVEPWFIPNTEQAINFYAPEAVPVITEAVRRLMEDGQSFDLELPFITAKGNHIWVRAIGQPQYENDRVVKINGVFQEITEQKQLEALRESELNYRTLADSGQALIWKAGTDKLCNYFNKVWLDFTGRTFEQEYGNGWTEGVHPDDFQRCLDVYITAFDKHEAFSMDYRLRRHDGVYRWIQDDGCPRYDINGNFVGYIGYCLDITTRKQTDEKLMQKNIEIEQFIYSVSHDLRSPLVTIRTFAGYLERDLATGNLQQTAEDLKFINTAADKMYLLLNELLEMSRIGRQENPITAITFRELADGAVSAVAGRISELKVDIRISDTNITLFGDRPRLTQVWQNLLDNAIKYLGDQPTPFITVGAEQKDNDVVFFICDNGIGIAPENLDKIFNVFEKLGQESTGVGMGLAMVKRIVELNGGRIWVDSKGPGLGSCFRFTLPDALPALDGTYSGE